MAEDSIDRMVGEWARSAPELDAGVLHVVGRLFRSAEIGQRMIAEALRSLGLSYGDFDVLNTLRRRGEPAGTKPTELARSSLITSGAMTARLDRLDRLGLVRRERDPDDRRGVLVHLTERGERVAEQALDAVLAADERFLAPLDADRRAQLAAILKPLLLHHESG
ncbi:MarR family winged helix-turn-helix transcriptional regulator [Allonocardiopsis opalescens]|uniref:DNA-binding MarR family transcriptional regulator n=1 Tax=Allonocardiopsis opalescens TaxID=1144618 RepID=A0A2T0QCL0_9ACTN|nr:MarR family transcriptional regulator [Allonocardiopsis opalescens]PRY01657.1 DNA-binding MarR family transcriptional regulator [Allonocardiopsis opalescens]